MRARPLVSQQTECGDPSQKTVGQPQGRKDVEGQLARCPKSSSQGPKKFRRREGPETHHAEIWDAGWWRANLEDPTTNTWSWRASNSDSPPNTPRNQHMVAILLDCPEASSKRSRSHSASHQGRRDFSLLPPLSQDRGTLATVVNAGQWRPNLSQSPPQ